MEIAAEKDLVVVGHLMRPHGFRGEIKCAPETHDKSRCRKLSTVYANIASESLPLEVESARVAGDIWLLKFKGYDSLEAVRSLVNADICIPLEERIPAPEGMYYFSDLEGFSVIGDSGTVIGTVLSVERLPSVNAFRFTYKGSEVLAPWIKECVGEIDSGNRTVNISEKFLDELFGRRVGC